MTLRRFNADRRAASARLADKAIDGVNAIKTGDSEGEVVVTLVHQNLPGPLNLRLIAQDVSEYPEGNNFLLFTDSEHVPKHIVTALENLQNFCFGHNIIDTIVTLSTELRRILDADAPGDRDVVMADAETEDEDDEDDDDDDDDDDEFDAFDDEFGLKPQRVAPSRYSDTRGATSAVLKQIRRDLNRVRSAGFKVGILSGLEPSSRTHIISMSIRAGRLALSDEALQAWHVEKSDYIVLLVRVDEPYPTFAKVVELAVSTFNVEFRIGKCQRYKPSVQEAMASFSSSKRLVALDNSARDLHRSKDGGDKFKRLFISKSLEDFMNENFLSLVKIRHQNSSSWDEANEMLKTRRITHHTIPSSSQPTALVDGAANSAKVEADDTPRALPSILLVDHLAEKDDNRSVPLIAMQFAMRYLVRCTEYCLRCHCRLPKGFEALKPYVCSDPLCLFQYMAMGFGPCIEHEIWTQPYVVDLLVSFCYSSVSGLVQNRSSPSPATPTFPIREFPVGLRLKVPNIYRKPDNDSSPPIKVKTDDMFRNITVQNAADCDRLAAKMWVAFHRPTGVSSGNYSTTNNLDPFGYPTGVITPYGQTSTLSGDIYHGYITSFDREKKMLEVEKRGHVDSWTSETGYVLMDMYLYEVEFDDLADQEKAKMMTTILDTLPPIMDIRKALSRQPSLKSYDLVSPAAATLLEWIVASNRSCIFQVDVPCSDGIDQEIKTREHEKITGMNGWIQFRFAQGAPDKEIRFHRALKEVGLRKNQHFPTLFAWHGSALCNWHSILRQGLDFTTIHNGRAFGNGVYFSQDYTTSQSYAMASAGFWPSSSLKIGAALSLNEIINAPDEFVSKAPHLVVSQVDWIQCRYLFVQSGNRGYGAPPPAALQAAATDKSSKQDQLVAYPLYPQDPAHTVRGPRGEALRIPLAAIPSGRVAQGSEAQRTKSSTKRNFDIVDLTTDEEDAEDLQYLFSDEETPEERPRKQLSRMSSESVDTVTAREMNVARPLTPAYNEKPMTDFRPGTLDLKSLPRLQEPDWKNPSSTKRLFSEVKQLEQAQRKTRPHELGWYIDFENMENMFQWIVELHSFDQDLPLAKDMKTAGITSIVIEIRFGRDYPFSPPFLRVIRPRFLPFMNGGGGHVTAGGAMCMELLTTTGWTPATSMEAVLVQVKMALSSLDPRPGRLQSTKPQAQNTSYGVGEALDAFVRAATIHGWTVPSDLRETANQQS